MRLYNFARLIKKYAVSCKLVSFTEGEWKAGKWYEGEKTETDISGAVVPINEKRIQNSGGSYKQGDCEFITTQPVTINSNTYLVHKEKKYKLEDTTDYSDYADFNVYTARRVSAFDTTRTNTTSNA